MVRNLDKSVINAKGAKTTSEKINQMTAQMNEASTKPGKPAKK